MLQMPFSRKGVTYPMRGSVYYPNLISISALLVGAFILYAVGQGSADVPAQLRAAGAFALPVTIYLSCALIGMIFVRRSSMTLPGGAIVACRALSAVALVTLLVAMVPYLLPEPPQGMTLPATLFWSVLGTPLVALVLGFAYALAWAPVTGSAADLDAREAEERRREREAEEERAAMKASSEARAKRRAERARRADAKRAAKVGKAGKSGKGSNKH